MFGIGTPLIYLIIKKKIDKWIRLVSFVIIGIGILRFSLLQFIGYPLQSEYAKLYVNPENEFETIKIIHNHSFNEVKQTITFPRFGINLERKFHQNNLNGRWFVYKDNPFHTTEGVFLFKKGELINN